MATREEYLKELASQGLGTGDAANRLNAQFGTGFQQIASC